MSLFSYTGYAEEDSEEMPDVKEAEFNYNEHEKEKLEEKLKMEIPLGAGSKVDEVAKEILNKYGISYLKDISKFSFKNTDKIK